MPATATFYPNTPVTRPGAIGEVRSYATLRELAEAVLDAGVHDPSAPKGAAGYVVAAPVLGPRSNAAARPTNVVALDYDDAPEGPDWAALEPYEYYAYTTDSHDPGGAAGPRWRVWVQLDRAYDAAEVAAAVCPWPGCYLRAISQPVYLPTKADDIEWRASRGGAPLVLAEWARPATPAPATWTPPARRLVPSREATNALVTRWLSRPEGTNRLAGATGAALAEWGWSDDEVREYVLAWVGAADPRAAKHADDAVRGARRRRAGDRIVGFPTLAEELGRPYEADRPAGLAEDVSALVLAAGAGDPAAEPAGAPAAPANADGWVTAATIAAWEPPPVPWLVEAFGLAPGAPALLTGYGGSGKTTFAQHLALAVATPGHRLLGEFRVRHGAVTHLDYEQGADLTMRRYQRLGLTADAQLRFRSSPPAYLLPADDRAAREWLVRACVGQALVVVDSLVAGIGPALDDENATTVREPLDFLGQVSAATGATVLVIHHSKKDRSNGRTSARGSSAITDAVALHLTYEKDDEAGPRSAPRLAVQKLRQEAPAAFAAWEPLQVVVAPRGAPADGGYTLVVGGTEADVQTAAAARLETEVVALLASGWNGSQEALRKETGAKRDVLQGVLVSLENAGVVFRTKNEVKLARAPTLGAPA